MRAFECPEELIAGCNCSNDCRDIKCYESMEEHLRVIKEFIDKYLSNYMRFIDAIANEILKVKVRVPLLYIASALHDLGKALPHFQSSLRSRCVAPYHELASATLTLLLDIQDLTGMGDEVINILVLTILMHHHAMRPLKVLYDNLPNVVKKAVPPISSDVLIECIEKYVNIANEVFNMNIRLGRVPSQPVNSLHTALIKYMKWLRDIFEGGIWEGRLKALMHYKLSIMVLEPLIMADIASASINRSCIKPRSIEGISVDVRLHKLVKGAIAWSNSVKELRRELLKVVNGDEGISLNYRV